MAILLRLSLLKGEKRLVAVRFLLFTMGHYQSFSIQGGLPASAFRTDELGVENKLKNLEMNRIKCFY